MGEEEMRSLSIHPCGTSRNLYMPTWDLPALLPIREEGVLRIFIALNDPSPWPGSMPQPLGPVASTLTTIPPRRQPPSTNCRNFCKKYFSENS
jgi:hypothetical protein